MRRASALRGALVLLGMVAVGTNARAHPFDLFGYGSRASAMGGAYTALADGYEASYYNPAGVVQSTEVRAGAGYLQSISTLELNGNALELRDTKLGAFVSGISAAGQAGGRQLGFSFAFALPNEGTIRASSLRTLQPNFVLLTNRTQRAEILATSGFELVPGLAVGAGFSVGAELDGDLQVAATTFPQTATGSGTIDIHFQFFPTVGILATPWESWRFGLTYRGEQAIPLRIPAAVTLLLVPGSTLGADLRLVIEQRYFFTPQQVVLGVAWDPASAWTVSTDLAWSNWAAAKDPGVGGELRVSGALAPLLPLPTIHVPVDPNFHDIVTPRIGVEWRPLTRPMSLAAVRAGYGYEPSPAPAPIGEQNLLDSNKHIASLGIGFALRDPWGILRNDADLDLHAQYFRFERRTARKIDPTDPVGDLVFGGDRWLLGGMFTIHF